MHSTADLRSSSFTITVAGRPATITDIWPGFDERDRLGVVVRRPGGAVGASTLILATITAFYDFHRARGGEFFVYPDYYVFHVGRPRGDHAMLDIWPAHKEVVVPDDAESILRAINDRAITRLLVEDIAPGQPTFARQTLASSARIRTVLAYAPHGRTEPADVTVAGGAATESYVAAVLERSLNIRAADRAAIRAVRAHLLADDRPIEHYQRLSVEEGLARLGSAERDAAPSRSGTLPAMGEQQRANGGSANLRGRNSMENERKDRTSQDEKLAGKGDELKGKAQQAWGSLTDDEKLQAEGQANEAKGKLRQTKGDVQETVENAKDRFVH